MRIQFEFGTYSFSREYFLRYNNNFLTSGYSKSQEQRIINIMRLFEIILKHNFKRKKKFAGLEKEDNLNFFFFFFVLNLGIQLSIYNVQLSIKIYMFIL